MFDQAQLRKGTLEGCILKIIDREPTYGYAIATTLRDSGFADLTEGTLYPLLLAALSLAAMSGQYPFVVGWVTAKVLGVIAYIILGALALRDAGTRRMRIACWLASLAVFGWIVSVALTRQPLGFLAAVT